MRAYKHVPLIVAVALWLGASTAGAQTPNETTGREAARPIATAAMLAYDSKQYAAAISGFTKADALYPTPNYRIYIARANKWLGKLASAARAYESAMGLQPGQDAPRDFASVQSTAASELAEIRPKIPRVDIEIQGAPRQEVNVTMDGVLVPTVQLERAEVDPGDHTFQATAPGFKPASVQVKIEEATLTPILLKLERAPVTPRVPKPTGQEVLARGPTGSGSTDAPPKDSVSPYSHRWKPGLLVRGDIDPLSGGVRLAPGLSFGLFDHMEIGVTALIGRDAGIEPLARGFFLSGSWKPLLEVAVPIFIVSGGRPGVRGAVGIQWHFHPHFGVFAEVGGAYFPEPPPQYRTAYFLPSIGLQGRL